MRFEAESTQLIQQAASLARELGHSYVGSEHLLMALGNQSGWIGQLLDNCGFNGKLARLYAASVWGRGTPDLPLPQGLTGTAKQILGDAGKEARRLGSRRIGRSALSPSR